MMWKKEKKEEWGGRGTEEEDYTKKKMMTQDTVNRRANKRSGDGRRPMAVAPLRLEDIRELQENLHTHAQRTSAEI